MRLHSIREAIIWDNDSVLLYRGAPQQEQELENRSFPGVYLTIHRKTAEGYGKNVFTWRFPKSELLDADSPRANKIVARFFSQYGREYDADQAKRRNQYGDSPFVSNQFDIANREDMWDAVFLYPTEQWVRYLKSLGFAGTSNGGDVFVFDKSQLTRVRGE